MLKVKIIPSDGIIFASYLLDPKNTKKDNIMKRGWTYTQLVYVAIALGIACPLTSESLKQPVDLRNPLPVYRITVDLQNKKIVKHQQKGSEIHIQISNTLIEEFSESITLETGETDIRTLFEPYNKAGYDYISYFSIIPEPKKKLIHVKYGLKDGFQCLVRYLSDPYRLIIEFFKGYSSKPIKETN